MANLIQNDFKKFAKSYGVPTTTSEAVMKNGAITSLSSYVLEETQLHATPLEIYSRLMVDRILFLGHTIDSEVCNVLVAQLLYLDSIGNNTIKLYINSPGGSVSDGLMVISTMELINSRVATYCAGTCASMGAVILGAGTKGERKALRHSQVMIHQPSTGLGDGNITASDIEITSQHIKATKQKLTSLLAEYSGQPFERVAIDCERDYWMDAKAALDYGLIDAIVEPTPKK